MNEKQITDLIERMRELGHIYSYQGAKNLIREYEKLNKPEKVKVPQCVADVIEGAKEQSVELEDAFEYVWEVATGELREWFRKLENRNNFARAWLDGYEVEEEKRYLVKIKGNIKENVLVYGELLERYFFMKNLSLDNVIYSHARKELEEAGFSWVFDCPGIEIEEVEGWNFY